METIIFNTDVAMIIYTCKEEHSPGINLAKIIEWLVYHIVK